LSIILALYALIAGLVSFSGWALDIPRFTDWFNDGVSTQPNTSVLVVLAGMAILLLRYHYDKLALALAGFVAVFGALNLLQYVINTDFGFNHQLLFGRDWGYGATVTPGRFGPPASISFILIGMCLLILGKRNTVMRCYVPGLALFVVLLMMFSLLGFLFGARNFYAIPWLSAIAFPSATMLLAFAVSLILSVPERHPTLLLCERSSAGSMARTVLPILIIMIPLVIWLRSKGFEHKLFDVGTGRALGAATQMLGVVGLMWIALMALRRREQRERETDRRKDEFLATLAHELRNPLAPIFNATALLKLTPGDREVAGRATSMIDRQLMHLVRLIDDLLDMSRISRGRLELRRERIELAGVIQQAIETCRPLADSAGQEVVVTLPAHATYLFADPVRLAQVISNLLNNACKFTGQGGRISLIVEQQGSDVVISVKDNGIGIPSDMLGAIFEMFSQVDQSLERSQNGLGIGLTLAKRLVELHGGSIKAQSDGRGKGSEFVVRLPAVVDGERPQVNVASQNINESSTQSRILIVDDNVDSAKSLAEVLGLTGNETFVAHDGVEAVEAAERHRPDVILLDIGLPKLNGYDVCRRIRANPWAANILIIVLTGWGQESP
jgi:signal transduction histidine kinase